MILKNINIEINNTTKQIGDLVDWLILYHASPEQSEPTMYIDLEGVDLCREGSISIFTLLFYTGAPTARLCLIDVHTMGSQAFNTPSIKRKTLKDILQNEKIPKVFFDVRNDSDALCAHFGVALDGVVDVQLMESARRTTTGSRKFLNGLAKCVEECALSGKKLASWRLVKEKGERLFKTEYGGSYEVFNERPIPNDIISYCVGDVEHLPTLWERSRYQAHRWRDLVNDKTKERVAASQQPEYQPHGPNRALASWSEDQNKTLDEWNYVPRHDYFDDDYLDNYDCFDDEWYDDDGCNDYEDWTRADWQGPPS